MAKLIPWLFLIPPALVALVAAITLLYARTPRGRALKYLRVGGDRVFQQKPDEAEAAFRSGIELLPDHAPLVGSLASLLVEQERFEEARPLLERARKLDPGDARLTLIQGRCHQGLGEPDKAVELWSSLPEESDIYPDAMSLIADERERSGDLAGAAEHLEKAISKATVFQARPYKKELKRLQDMITGS